MSDEDLEAQSGPGPGKSVGDRIIDWLGEENADRRRPGLPAAFSGIGGAFAGFGLLMVVIGDDTSRFKFVYLSLLLLALGLALRLLPTPSEAKAAAVGLAVVAIPTFSIAATVSDGGGEPFLTGALMAVLCFAAWALPGYQHTHILLGIGAIALVSAFGSLTAPDAPDMGDMGDYAPVAQCDTYMNEGDYDAYNADNCDQIYNDYYDSMPTMQEDTFLPLGISDNLGDEGIIYLGGAVVFFGLTWWLDRRGRRGPGAALCAAALLSALSGSIMLAAELGTDTGPVLVTIVGLVVCVVGTHGRRRATTWWGAAMTASGLVWLITNSTDPSSTRGSGGAIILSGLILVGLAAAAGAVIRAQATPAPAESPMVSEPVSTTPPDSPEG